MQKFGLSLIFFVISIMLLSACGGSGGGSDSVDGGADGSEDGGADGDEDYEAQIRSALDNYESDTDFTLLLKKESGETFSYSTGSSTATTSYRSASTSKMVTAAVILSIVEAGDIALTDHPQAYIDFWPSTGNLSQITLGQLLSFTSGLTSEPLCINLGWNDFEDCVESILNANTDIGVPGSEFYYASTHMQVAGMMAYKAAGLSSWEALFAQFKSQTGLFPTSIYDLPSTSNPRLAGGMHWTGSEYLAFLEAVYKEDILTPELITEMTSDQFNGAVISYSPVLDAMGRDWHYGYGSWIECKQVPFDCSQAYKVSSAGAYGAYPFIDFTRGYYGIVAREGALGTFPEGVATFEAVENDIESWAE